MTRERHLMPLLFKWMCETLDRLATTLRLYCYPTWTAVNETSGRASGLRIRKTAGLPHHTYSQLACNPSPAQLVRSHADCPGIGTAIGPNRLSLIATAPLGNRATENDS